MNKILKMMLNFHGTILSPNITNEPPHGKTNIMTCAPSEDSDQPVHPPSLIRVFAVRSVRSSWPKLFHANSEDSDHWAEAQANLSFRWAHMPLNWFCHEAVQMSL